MHWLTVWLTPHIKTLRMGSLARNNFTFCPIKCFFFVLVLLALTAAALVQLADMSAFRRRSQKQLKKNKNKNWGENYVKCVKQRSYEGGELDKCIVVQLSVRLWVGCVNGSQRWSILRRHHPSSARAGRGGVQRAANRPSGYSAAARLSDEIAACGAEVPPCGASLPLGRENKNKQNETKK